MEEILDKYYIEQEKLIKEITEDRLTCKEAQERCTELFKLIPATMLLSPRTLNDLMKSKFENDPDYTYSKKYTIVV